MRPYKGAYSLEDSKIGIILLNGTKSVICADGQVDHDCTENDQTNSCFESQSGQKPGHWVGIYANTRDCHIQENSSIFFNYSNLWGNLLF